MRLWRGFLTTSLASYVAMLIFVINDIDLVGNMSTQQKSGFLSSLLFCAVIIWSLYDNSLNLIWCGVFGAWALVSYLGLVQWHNYFNGTDINLFMAIWDLLIGVAMYYESELYV